MAFGQFAEPSRAPVAVAEMEGEALEKALVWLLSIRTNLEYKVARRVRHVRLVSAQRLRKFVFKRFLFSATPPTLALPDERGDDVFDTGGHSRENSGQVVKWSRVELEAVTPGTIVVQQKGLTWIYMDYTTMIDVTRTGTVFSCPDECAIVCM